MVGADPTSKRHHPNLYGKPARILRNDGPNPIPLPGNIYMRSGDCLPGPDRRRGNPQANGSPGAVSVRSDGGG